LSLDAKGRPWFGGGARDYSPNNRGFAMADQRMKLTTAWLGDH